ncbi:probable receptor-like protein kinase At1g80640 [Argentina anserina]|uniref:probable receptor-like protein kinase At1g80640 n=1 Tax=Argentina anserina TaxID=57926 RepID=UPI0021765EBE|nr:probable receptor-like protein kinase At1g80640 [Potentilla anserina]
MSDQVHQDEEIYQKASIQALSKGPSSLQSHSNGPWRELSEGADCMLGLPKELSWEMVDELTQGFRTRIPAYENGDYLAYEGLRPVNGTKVTVKRYTGEWRTMLEREKKAAVSMHHKNILRLTAFYDGEVTAVLVFPLTIRGTLHTNLYGSMGNLKLKFQQKLKIAIDIARGLRYMHEECPQGPVIHGNLLITNIFLRNDLSPMISGFGRAKWLHLKQAKPISNENQRPSLRDYLDHDAIALVKSDVLSYGVLLLRLFCKSSALQDDKTLIEWARPKVMKRAFHELLDEDWEDADMHEMFKVMCSAFQCTMSSPDMRPCMSAVISYLKGENLMVMQTSPSFD